MRNMSNIPKLPEQRGAERSSCCSVKVGAHNKEASERTLTSQWPSCPAEAPLAALRSCRGASPRNESDSWAKTGWFGWWGGVGRGGREEKKKGAQKCEFGSKRTRGGKRTEAWRRKHAHTQKFCGSSANSAHHAQLLCGGTHAAKKVLIYNAVALSSSRGYYYYY